MELSQKILSDLAVHMKYSRFLKDKGRRETYEEIVDRNKKMHQDKFPELQKEIEELYQPVYERKVLPSMRSMQFAGYPIERNPSRIYNCAYLPMSEVDAFSEIMFLLLGGTGVGYSVQFRHINKLPLVVGPKERTRRYKISDNIEGWGDAVKVLMESYFHGRMAVRFDYSDIRDKGSELVVTGGKAPGPEPLRICLEKIRAVLNNARGRNLTPLEVHDINCFIADAVLVGGIRRAAMISLFSHDDWEMMTCKTGRWWEFNAQRGRANNSVILKRNETSKEQFKQIWKAVEASNAGEPGIYWTNNLDWGTNPCLHPDSLVETIHGRVRIADIKEPTQVYTMKEDGSLGIAQASASWISKKDAKVIKLTTRNGKSIKVTPDHKICVTTVGTKTKWKEAKDIELGECIVQLCRARRGVAYSGVKLSIEDNRAYQMEHRMIADAVYGIEEYHDVHHIDGDTYNNSIDNLEVLSHFDHSRHTALFDNPQTHQVHGENGCFVVTGISPKTVIPMPEELRSGMKNQYSCAVVKIEEVEEKVDVYDLTVEGTHNFIADFMVVHNCAEIALRPYQFCNLVEINGSDVDGQEDFNSRVCSATGIATLQASYTDFHYLRDVWKRTTEEDALIGVGITGIASRKLKGIDWNEAAKVCSSVNNYWANRININSAARRTTIKPSGTSSIVLGSSSGIHSWHNNYYLRRMRVNKDEAIYQYLLNTIPQLVEDSLMNPEHEAIIVIPQKAPRRAITRQESASSLFHRVIDYNNKWVRPGTFYGDNHNNVSATISLKKDDWFLMGELMWKHRDDYNGISVLPYDGGTYVQAPFEDCTKAKYEKLEKHLNEIDLTQVREDADYTDLTGEVACAGGSCEVTF